MRQEALVTVKVAHLLIAFVLLSGSRTLAQPLPDPPELGVISSEFWAPCDCYYDDECKETGKCSPGNCSPGMEDTDSPLDGRCRSAPPFSTEQLEQVAKAVELYFQAFLATGRRAGGPPDSNLVRQAQALPLSVEDHLSVQILVNDAMDLTLGFDSLSPQLRFGSAVRQVPRFGGDYPPEAAALIDRAREGVVEAIRGKDPGLVAGPIQEFWKRYPDYVPLHKGRCYDHGHSSSTYETAAECQIESLQRELAGLLGTRSSQIK